MSDYMINIVICDDERIETEYLTSLVRKWMNRTGVSARISKFESAESFLFNYDENKSVDIMLLDIQMKEINGVELARKIRCENDAVQIIFITGYPDFIAEGYDVSALHYLMKPVKTDKLFDVLERAKKNIKQAEKSLFLTIDGQIHRIPHSEIRYIEAQGHYINIMTIFGEYKTKKNLSEIQKSFGEGFFRCQRSFIVNLKFVRKITRTVIVLDNMTEIPLSRNLYDAANQAVIKFFP